jgi:trehalose 6-phosphate synthase/phosphatase
VCRRHVRVSAFPIGVDNDNWQKTALSESVQARTAELRKEFSGRKMILSVDRFDYTKGIVRRLLAFQRLFKGELA